MSLSSPPCSVTLFKVDKPPSMSSPLESTFSTSHDNGGASVTQYKIEWEAMDLDGIAKIALSSSSAALAIAD